MPKVQPGDKSDCLLVLEEMKKTVTWPASYPDRRLLPALSPDLTVLPPCHPPGTQCQSPQHPRLSGGCLQPPPQYSRDPGGPLVLKTQESSGIDAEQKAAVLQQVQAERPCCQDDFIGSLGHGELHAVVVTARDRKPGKKIRRDINKDRGPRL